MQQAPVNPLVQLMPLIAIFIIFYFLLIRPQKQQQREHQKMMQNLVKNDEVITTGGLHGKIINVKDKTVVLRIDENTKAEVEKNCIAAVKR